MLSACATAGAAPTPSVPDPIIEVRSQTRVVCPDDLFRALPSAPAGPPAGAVIQHNDAGGDYLDARMARGQAAEQVVIDSQAACAELPHG